MGLFWLFFGKEGRRYQIFGWAFGVMLVTFIVLKGKNYYLAPAYPILFAAGAIAFERLTSYVNGPSPRSKVSRQCYLRASRPNERNAARKILALRSAVLFGTHYPKQRRACASLLSLTFSRSLHSLSKGTRPRTIEIREPTDWPTAAILC